MTSALTSELFADQLVSKWRPVLDQAEHIFSWTEPHALAFCAEQASKAKYAVELGTYMGRSAFVMLRANPLLRLWCVDSFAVAGTKQCCEHFLKSEIVSGRCELITGDSATAAPMLLAMEGLLDFVWVDDGHAVEDVKRDIQCFLPLIKPTGLIFGHDYDNDNDVAQGVQASLPHWALPVPRVWAYQKP